MTIRITLILYTFKSRLGGLAPEQLVLGVAGEHQRRGLDPAALLFGLGHVDQRGDHAVAVVDVNVVIRVDVNVDVDIDVDIDVNVDSDATIAMSMAALFMLTSALASRTMLILVSLSNR